MPMSPPFNLRAWVDRNRQGHVGQGRTFAGLSQGRLQIGDGALESVVDDAVVEFAPVADVLRQRVGRPVTGFWLLSQCPANDGVQVATQAFEATWREPEGQERHQVWTHMSHLYPPYLAYQASTERHIPVVMLEPVRPIHVFTE